MDSRDSSPGQIEFSPLDEPQEFTGLYRRRVNIVLWPENGTHDRAKLLGMVLLRPDGFGSPNGLYCSDKLDSSTLLLQLPRSGAPVSLEIAMFVSWSGLLGLTWEHQNVVTHNLV